MHTQNTCTVATVRRLDSLESLFKALQNKVDTIFGPTLKQGAISYDQINSFSQLPVGLRDRQKAGGYRIEQTKEPTYFGFAVGPSSLKKIIHPSSRKLWECHVDSEGKLTFKEEVLSPKKIAVWGVRSCDIESIKVLDKVFDTSDFRDPFYSTLRENLYLVSATCINPSDVCFCTSMQHGPYAKEYDINITEVFNLDEHYFIIESGSERGTSLIESLTDTKEADRGTVEQIANAATRKIKKKLDTTNISSLLDKSLNNEHWDSISQRCLSCGNCTMVCPTCFCTTVTDKVDLEGEHSERWLEWDSCFTSDFSYVHGGEIRKSARSRYRQWLTHKLGSWTKQFGVSGCVGCGRCITWCPVEIDITNEMATLREKTHENNL